MRLVYFYTAAEQRLSIQHISSALRRMYLKHSASVRWLYFRNVCGFLCVHTSLWATATDEVEKTGRANERNQIYVCIFWVYTNIVHLSLLTMDKAWCGGPKLH